MLIAYAGTLTEMYTSHTYSYFQCYNGISGLLHRVASILKKNLTITKKSTWLKVFVIVRRMANLQKKITNSVASIRNLFWWVENRLL